VEATKARRNCSATVLPGDWNQEKSPQGLDAQQQAQSCQKEPLHHYYLKK
jgi:hypothetical protein